MVRHDSWKRRRQNLSPLTQKEMNEVFVEKEKASGFYQRAAYFHKNVLAAVDDYAKVHKTTKRMAWDTIMRAGIAALKL